jgi:pimeloyl-ACP methyl ester carboxylesterase
MSQPIRDRRIRVSEVELDVSEAGPPSGPLLFLLHGFPENRASWRRQLATAAGLGWLAVAPDQRGYNRSSKPKGVAAYDLDRLAQDVSELAAAYGRARYSVIGHDWGAGVGWWIASQRPAELERLLALSAPHPAVWRHAMFEEPEQRRRSGYVKFLGLPALPEMLIRMGGYRGLETPLKPLGLSEADWTAYRQAWREPGALTGMINWYRALLARPFGPPSAYRVTRPALYAYGAEDPFLADVSVKLTAGLGSAITLHRLEGVGHWLMHEAPEQLDALIKSFLGDAGADDRQ